MQIRCEYENYSENFPNSSQNPYTFCVLHYEFLNKSKPKQKQASIEHMLMNSKYYWSKLEPMPMSVSVVWLFSSFDFITQTAQMLHYPLAHIKRQSYHNVNDAIYHSIQYALYGSGQRPQNPLTKYRITSEKIQNYYYFFIIIICQIIILWHESN